MITRTRFVQVSVDLLEQCAERKGVLFVYLWLWHYAGQNDTAFPSIARLAAECRMKDDHVRAALRWLVDQGWVSRIDRAGATTVFRVRSEHPTSSPPLDGVTPPPNGGALPNNAPSPQSGEPPLPQTGEANNKDLTRKKKPPISPNPQTAEPDPQSKAVRTRITLTETEIPETLQPAAALICQFWNHAKAGQRTQRALAGQLRELEAIATDRRGGITALRQQLQKAITAAEIGSAWRAITHERWLAFGLSPAHQRAETRPSLPALPPMSAEEQAHMRLLQNPAPSVFGRNRSQS